MFTTKTRLPQYFFGDGINQNDKLADSISLGMSSMIVEDFHVSEPNLSRIPSPASSLASTKKLEWDSGADIGYNLYSSLKNSRRSKSFPSLNLDLSISQINKSDETQGDEISMENKVTSNDDVAKEISNINSQCTSQSITRKDRKNNFKHSTPYGEKMISKIIEKSKTKNSNKNKDAGLQTTLIHICSKSVQTDENFIKNGEKSNKSQQTDTLTSQSSSSGSSLSKSSSFQYIPGSKESTSENTESTRGNHTHRTESKQSHSVSVNSEISKSSSITSSSKNHTEESNSSNTSPLGKMISTQQSKHLIEDIDKSLNILQKFIKSKNYTVDTKKYYARKIVNKIINSKYTDDSSGSTSSAALSTYKSSEEPIAPNVKSKSNDNINVNDFITKENRKSKKVNCGIQCDPIQKTIATETNKSKKITEKLEKIVSTNNKFTEENKHKNKSDSSLNITNKNWKEAETLSEKLFEARKKSLQSSQSSNNTTREATNSTKKSEYLIQHSKNEKKRQLSWINNEISYLHKLQELLQQNDSSSNTSINGATKIKLPPPLSKSQQSISTHENISSSISDIEMKFYQEFGTSDLSKITENMENMKKLSKYLTNDQLKHLIENDAKNLHSQTCECCQRKSLNADETKSPVPYKNKTSLQEFTAHQNSHRNSLDMNRCSFNSHNNYKFYENLINTCNPSKKSNQGKIVSKKSDAGIQCTLKKKKCYPTYQRDDTSYSASTEYGSNDNTNIQVFYRNISNFDNFDSQSTVYGRIESEIVPEFKGARRNEKENYYQKRPVKYRSKQTKPSKPIAYFLTFEEESMNEYAQNSLKRNMLKKVTVKVPKLLKPANRNETESYQKKTLHEYLMENRPDFVKSAEWRRNVISDQTEKRPRNIFTCAQMKELTSKKYSRLPEVQSKIHTCRVNNEKLQNRYMARVFSKKLQKKTLKGQMSIATCINVMSSD